MLKKNFLDIIQGAIFLALAVVPIIDVSVIKIPIGAIITIVTSCLIGYCVIAVIKIKKNKDDSIAEFEEGSDNFFKFFTEWYGKHGKLSIFCSDLDWMRKDQYNIIDIICKKGKNCKVYLREDVEPEIRRTLEEKNVQVSSKHDLLTKHRFSLLEDENASFLIITDRKGGNDNKIVIKKEDNENNPYIITVVKDLLDSMDGSEG